MKTAKGEVKRVLKITMTDPETQLILHFSDGEAFMEEMKHAWVGDVFTVTIVEMTQEELDNLLEFDGW